MSHLVNAISRTAAVAALITAMLAAAPANAVTVFNTTLSPLNQVPIEEAPGYGTGQLTLATDQNSFTVVINYNNLSSTITGAHVHCCTTTTANAPIAVEFTLPNPGGFSGNVTGTYDLTQANTYTSAFLTANGGTAASARSTFLTGLTSGLAYLNVHSQSHPSGEIRGQLPAIGGAVPEPASWAMMITGFALVGGTMRRRTGYAAQA